MIVPRAENTVLRVSRYIIRGSWKAWPPIAYAFYRDARKREDFLATYAPFVLIVILVVWVVMLVLGWGLVFYGLRGELRPVPQTFGECVYFAGASLLTIGYGDIVAHDLPGRMLALVSAASGLGVVAVVTAFLFSTFGAFQRREKFVVTVGARAGQPPSGVGLLAVHGELSLQRDIAEVFREGQGWVADVMESHLAYPILSWFRSSHDYESWVGTLGTLMDASALVLTTIESDAEPGLRGQAKILYSLGRHLTHDFSDYYAFGAIEPQAGVERMEFDDACDRLTQAGFVVKERESAWAQFSAVRATYASTLNAMARWLEIPPIQWVGDRSFRAHH